ncbi:MAG TPA: MFS transporter, partial [Bryobacteraceae bacterium]
AFSMLGALAGGLAVGLWSDRIGRRKAMVLALIGAILVVPIWTYSPNLVLLVIGAFLMQFMVQGAWGVIPAHLAELSPDSVRGFLPGFAYQCGVLLASSIVYIQAVFATRMSYATAMALTGTTVFILAAIMTLLGKEKRGITFGE